MPATHQSSPNFPCKLCNHYPIFFFNQWHPISSFPRASMAAVSASSLAFQLPLFASHQVRMRTPSSKLFSPRLKKSEFPALRTSRFQVCCAAKPETVDKVCAIVRKQLALSPESELTPESTFSSLGADSLDTVEIVMGLEEEFDISVEEENSQNITNVQEAADLIEKLVQQKLNA